LANGIFVSARGIERAGIILRQASVFLCSAHNFSVLDWAARSHHYKATIRHCRCAALGPISAQVVVPAVVIVSGVCITAGGHARLHSAHEAQLPTERRGASNDPGYSLGKERLAQIISETMTATSSAAETTVSVHTCPFVILRQVKDSRAYFSASVAAAP
jgi:hypothetical protein